MPGTCMRSSTSTSIRQRRHRRQCPADRRLRPGHAFDCAQDVGYWQTKGYYEVLDSLYADIPEFLLRELLRRRSDQGLRHPASLFQGPEPGPLLPTGRPAVVLRFVPCTASNAVGGLGRVRGPSGRQPVRSTSSARPRWVPPAGTRTLPSVATAARCGPQQQQGSHQEGRGHLQDQAPAADSTCRPVPHLPSAG